VTSNVAASVHQRLLNRAHATGRPFNELLQYFVLERFLSPVTSALIAGHPFEQHWLAGGPWRPGRLARP
jgi:hypothetical protein